MAPAQPGEESEFSVGRTRVRKCEGRGRALAPGLSASGSGEGPQRAAERGSEQSAKAPLPLPPRKKFQKKGASQSFSKAARLKWQSLERRIIDIVMQRMTIVNLEADMERLIKKREELFLLQEALRRKRERLQAESPEEEKGLQELAEEIEVLAANIDYINDSITDCQATIMQLEETKVPTGPSLAGGGGSKE